MVNIHKPLSRRSFAFHGATGLSALLGIHRAEAVPSNPPLTKRLQGKTGPGPDFTINVRDFGALGDGQADDAPAINSALRAVRARQSLAGQPDIGFRILFPTGEYVLNSTIDLTSLRDKNTLIDGNASVLAGRCAGKPVIDAFGSRYLTVRDLTIVGDEEATPSIGIQIGRLSHSAVADDHLFGNVKIVGNYALSCLYNRAAETTEFDHLLLWNGQPNSFCIIQDGVNHFGLSSEFARSDLPADTNMSFNENVFISCDFRHFSGGSPVWLGDTARHAFIRCYASTSGGPAFIVFCGQNGHSILDVDCHCETAGLRNVFLVTGKSDHATIRGFSYVDHQCFAADAVLRCDNQIKRVEIQRARLEIAAFSYPRCTVFDQPEKWSVTGSYYSGDGGQWNGDNIFHGLLFLGLDVTFIGAVHAKIWSGPTSQRPAVLGPRDEGTLFQDSSLQKLLVWTGVEWVDATGSKV